MTHNLPLEWAYRQWGHTLANLDPLGLDIPTRMPDLPLQSAAPLNLEKIYAQTVGLEFMHVENAAERAWLQEQFENRQICFTPSQQQAFLEQLQKTELLEQFLQTKFPGAKRFSIEGNDTLIPALEHSLALIAKNGTKKVILGMSHRGRLSVMAHILKKPLSLILADFYDHSPQDDFPTSGDVKYHQGYQAQRIFEGHPLDISILSNASHLESIVPVALGHTRSLQSQKIDTLAILIHGDAAFAGQGIVFESLQLSQLPGYQVGGALHLILNNQIGFTTTPQEGRSTRYCSDVAKAMGCPIFHVNGDDVETVMWAFEKALQYRSLFHKDSVIDLVGYRRHGHNEGDEPRYTNPLMYQAIAEKPRVATLYAQSLAKQGVLTDGEALKQSFVQSLRDALESKPNRPVPLPQPQQQPHPQKVDLATLKKLGLEMVTIPQDFHPHPKLERILAKRREQLEKEETIDWALAESLAFASLVKEGHPLRLAGQDSKRGTFSQRHAEWVDVQTNKSYTPFQALGGQALGAYTQWISRSGFENKDRAPGVYEGVHEDARVRNFRKPDLERRRVYEGINSPLSEAAALGFEYGHSLSLKGLVIWEAQFGDFVNGAQIMIDQYIAAGYSKWGQSSNLVLLLPHGYEGQGPEHSSARLERFLQLSAEENWRVAVCTTPANFFHLLRQQVHQTKPLIALTPKSLLRHPDAVSPWQHFHPDVGFKPVIRDDDKDAENLILCTGKVYYDLLAYRQQHHPKKTALVRLEQVYPFPEKEITALLKNNQVKKWVWCQEEPQNMGAWSFVAPLLKAINPRGVYGGRPAAASPATGFVGRHAVEQQRLVEQAFLE